jgi:malate permease and related proteins
MTENLFHAYTPLIVWTSLGIVLFRILPHKLPKLLGKTLYWVGVPIEILALARQTNYGDNTGLAPLITAISLGIGLGLGWLAMRLRLGNSQNGGVAGQNNSDRGSFLLCGMLGNTGFVGLAIVPQLVNTNSMSWAIFYSVTQNVVGTYGLGVLISSYFGRTETVSHWRTQLRDLLTVPSLWAFAIGSLTRSVPLPSNVESGLAASIWVVIPAAFLLMGMRLSQIQGWKSLRLAILPVIIKVLLMPICMGAIATLFKLTGEDRLALVLMAGMPTAFAGLILAEEYELNRDLIASSIIVSTFIVPVLIPVWIALWS